MGFKKGAGEKKEIGRRTRDTIWCRNLAAILFVHIYLHKVLTWESVELISEGFSVTLLSSGFSS
jgi:hypothetical protein